MSDSKKLIVVMGSHRSGTSVCAAALESLGADLRLPATYTNDENPRGFFEHPDIIAFNDSLLSYLGGSWDNALFDGSKAISNEDLCDWRNQAGLLFETIFSDITVVAIKDPRLCQLFDFWKPVFFDAGFRDPDIYIIHILRDPVEVALSQQHRSQDNPIYYEIGGQLVEGVALWLSLTAQAIAQTVRLNCDFIDYAELVSTPELVFKKLARFVKVTATEAKLRDFCEDFVDASLRRSVADDEATAFLISKFPQAMQFNALVRLLLDNQSTVPDIIDRALALYRAPDTQMAISLAMAPALSRLSQRSRRDSLEVQLQANVIVDLQAQIADYASVIPPLRAELSQLEAAVESQHCEITRQRSEIKGLLTEIEEMRSNLVFLQDTIGEMETSTSWRLTTPVRWLGELRALLRERSLVSVARFRLYSIYQYQRMAVRHPRCAWVGRLVLRPLFSMLKHWINKNDKRFVEQTHSDWTKSMLYQAGEPSGDYQPLVTVIVPNFNHEQFLCRRLDSIYSQTYQNFEVILLDDASSDGSVELLMRYHRENADNTELLVNEVNSGGVFYQWQKGLLLAKGSIIWVAESDDWCSDNFLETLIPFFENEAVQLAYSRTVFMDITGTKPQWSIDEYLYDIDPVRWAEPFIETANKLVTDAFGIKNIIPNASSAIFRNPGAMELLQDDCWKNMRTCGDWIFYLHLIRGGALAYSPAACNYYRIHDENTSVKSHDDDVFYAEHEIVANTVQRYYNVDADVFRRQQENLITHWKNTRPVFSKEDFEDCYSLRRIEAEAAQRAPNVLMAAYGFCTGGGETFPVELANLMKAKGYNVTYVDFAQEPRNHGVRQRLRADIPVVSDFRQLERIIIDFGIDLIHSHHAWVDSTILDILPAKNAVKTVVTLHGMYETINSVDLKFILPRLVQRSSRLVYVAEKNMSSLEAYRRDHQKKFIRIENALSIGEFQPVLRSDIGIPDGAFVLMLISRAMEEKGWQEGIEIVSKARAQSARDIHLVLVGDGPEYDRLCKVGLPEFIHLEGFQHNIRGYFDCSDMGFLPSKFRGESFPMVIIECLQSGRPMLASRLGDIPYMLSSPEGPAGVLVELNESEINIAVWANEIIELATNKVACESLRSRVSSAAQKFDSAIMASKYDEVYRSVLDESV